MPQLFFYLESTKGVGPKGSPQLPPKLFRAPGADFFFFTGSVLPNFVPLEDPEKKEILSPSKKSSKFGHL